MAQSKKKYINTHLLDFEGIMQRNKSNEYLCCICNEIISEKALILKHVDTKSHIEALKTFMEHYQVTKSITIRCKMCQVTCTWETIRDHVKMHKLTSWYKQYFENFLIIHEDHLYCSLCTIMKKSCSWNDALFHINDKRHTTFLSSVNNIDNKFLKNPKILNKYESLVSNCLVYLDTKLFYCFICETKISGDIENLDEHIKGKYHNHKKLTIKIKDMIPLKKTVPIQNCSLKIPKKLNWIIREDDILVFTDSLYCDICCVTMINDSSMKSHLKRHERLRNQFKNKSICKNQYKGSIIKIDYMSSVAIVYITSTSNFSNGNVTNDIQCDLLLNIADHLKWMIKVLGIQISSNELYCPLCKFYMRNDVQVKSHLTKHFKKYSKKEKNQSSQSLQSIASNETKIKNESKNSTLKNNKSSFDTACVFPIAKEIKSSVYLSIFKENNIYCLVCQRDVCNNFQVYYDHIFSTKHLISLIDMNIKEVREEFIPFAVVNGNIKDNINAFSTCMLCNTKVRNIDESLYEHIKLKDHASYYCEWKEACLKFYNDILTFMKYNWYYTTKYYCGICLIEFSSEICFIEHMNKNEIHLNAGNTNYHSCVPCSLLWYDSNLSYSNHSKTPRHQYMISCGTYVAYNFPSEAKRFLMSFEENAEELLKFSQIAEIIKENEISKCLKNDTVSAFDTVKAYPYGSRICGLGLPDSDVNIFLDCLNTYNGEDVCSKNYSLEDTVKTINSILLSKPSIWHVNEIILDDGPPIIKVWHIPKQLNCTISFKNGLDVESTNLIKYFNEAYLPCRKLILVLKKWLSFCGLSGFPCISNYALTWCIIFYLQIMFILPSVTELIQENNKSKLIDGWQTGATYKFSARTSSKLSFVKLLSGFFIFYAEFDYRQNMICPLLGKTVEKKIFTDLSLLPNDMAPYVQYVRNAKNPKLFCLSPMSVQDPFNLSDNLTAMVKKGTLNNFRMFCSQSAEILTDLF